MAGILDSKSRIIDAILTLEGRRQVLQGNFKPTYFTFSDANCFYEKDKTTGGNLDPAERIMLENSCLPQDQVIFEADDTGKIIPFGGNRSEYSVNLTPGQNNSHGSTNVSVGLVAGKLQSREYHHGRIITISKDGVGYYPSDNGKTIRLDDANGNIIEIYVSLSSLSSAPTITTTGLPAGVSKRITLNVRGGVIASVAASLIKDGLYNIINTVQKENILYLDYGDAIPGQKLFFVNENFFKPWTLENNVVGGRLLSSELKLADFASQIDGILSSSFDNFKQQQIISSHNKFFEGNDFLLSSTSANFSLNDFDAESLKEIMPTTNPRIDNFETIMSDDKFSYSRRYRYMPPIVKITDDNDRRLLKQISGTVLYTDYESFLNNYLLAPDPKYPVWGEYETRSMPYEDFWNKYKKNKPTKVFDVQKSSFENKMLGQMFEIAQDGSITKLDILKIGRLGGGTKRNNVYFVGKVLSNSQGATVFLNIFVITFSDLTPPTEPIDEGNEYNGSPF